jgi:glycosyltransferase involved in cell wall biosynthesis
MLRVKNEARWIARVIRSIEPVCDQIILFDDHSDDGTDIIARSLGCEVIHSEFDTIHEARDKDVLLEAVWAAGAKVGDHCLMVDGDEMLHPEDVPAVQKAIFDKRVCSTMHIVYLWDREDQIRVDRWYKEFRRPSLFRLTAKNLSFRRTGFGGNFHCSSAPVELLPFREPIAARLLHFGYLLREDRVRKFHWYNSVDPNNQLEDGYRHMVIGDLFPADSRFIHAGPLELRPLA